MKTDKVFVSKLHWEIQLWATKVVEMVCINPWEPDPLKRKWFISRETDYQRITLQ
jgi:hypothetical protein